MRSCGWAVLVAVALAAHAVSAGQSDPLDKVRSADPEARLDGLTVLAGETPAFLAAKRSILHGILPKTLAKDPVPAVRAASARVLARVEGDDALVPLIDAIAMERDPEVERALLSAFAELGSDAARRALVRVAQDSSDPRAAALAAEALGFLPRNAGEDDLLTLVDRAPHWAVSAGACLGLGRIDDARAVGALVPRLRHPDPAVRSAARESLVRVALVDHGTDPAKWEEWWNGVRKDYRPPEKAASHDSGIRGRDTADRRSGDGAVNDDPTFARFFGVELRRRRVAFLIDYSQSMWGARRERAEQELVQAVKGMPTTSTFAVVLFNERVWRFRGGPLPARPQEKLDLATYLAEQVTKSYTNLYDALEDALGLAGIGPAAIAPAPGLDEMVVLSDGRPNRGKITQPAKILEAIRALDGGRVAIHAVALGDEPGDLLPQLAKENGGAFRACPFPK